jgi:hypothetical protein
MCLVCSDRRFRWRLFLLAILALKIAPIKEFIWRTLDHYDYPLYLSDVFETTKDVESSKLRAQINTILRIKLACHANNIIKLLKNQPHSQAQNSVQTCLDCCAQLDSQKLYLYHHGNSCLSRNKISCKPASADTAPAPHPWDIFLFQT